MGPGFLVTTQTSKAIFFCICGTDDNKCADLLNYSRSCDIFIGFNVFQSLKWWTSPRFRSCEWSCPGLTPSSSESLKMLRDGWHRLLLPWSSSLLSLQSIFLSSTVPAISTSVKPFCHLCYADVLPLSFCSSLSARIRHLADTANDHLLGS